jgi:hypothetical protein
MGGVAPMQNTHFMVPVELAQKLYDYLDQRPHREVRALIDGLMAAPGAYQNPVEAPLHQSTRQQTYPDLAAAVAGEIEPAA